MVEVIKVLISSIVLELGIIKTGEIILEEKPKLKKWKIIVLCILNAIIMTSNHLIVNNITKVIFSFMEYLLVVSVVYKKEMSKSIALTTLHYITHMVAEGITALFYLLYVMYYQ